jgi:hypothetical protein
VANSGFCPILFTFCAEAQKARKQHHRDHRSGFQSDPKYGLRSAYSMFAPHIVVNCRSGLCSNKADGEPLPEEAFDPFMRRVSDCH